MKSVLFTALLTLLSLAAQAGGTTVGNGGFVINCQGKVEVLDYWEMRQQGYEIAAIPGKSLDEKVESLLLRLEAVDPNRAKAYRYQYENNFKANLVRYDIEGIHLTSQDLNDVNLVRQFGLGATQIPQSCHLELAAQQASPDDPTKADWYNYSPKRRTNMTVMLLSAWDRLDLNQQAAIVMHELFYRENIAMFEERAIARDIRKLNGFLGTQEFLSLNVETWIQHLRSAKFTPLAPNFSTSERVLNFEAGHRLPGDQNYPLYWYDFTREQDGPVRAQLSGEITLRNGQTLQIISSVYNQYFISGLVPNRFEIPKRSVVDVSNVAKANLKISVDKTCIVEVDENLGVRKISADGDSMVTKACQSFLVEFSNPRVKFTGLVQASFANFYNNEDYPNVRLQRTQFSTLQVNTKKGWKDYDSIEVRFKDGSIRVPGNLLPIE